MAHPRIVTVDSDPEEDDIANIPPSSSSALIETENTFLDPAFVSPSAPSISSAHARAPQVANDPSLYKHYQCIYPVYFDINRSRGGGRKVPTTHAVENPLAREISDACASLGLKTVLEPEKTHPKDWANPGRVRVLLKEGGVAQRQALQNKFVLYLRIGEYLRAHPTTPETPLKLRLAGMPHDGKPHEKVHVPRGWKMGTILPLHSDAVSGGGMTDDAFKEIMQGMGMPGMDAPGTPGSSEVKEKKEKKKGKKK